MALVKYRLDLLITDPYYYRPFSKFWNTRWSLQSRFLFTLREKCPNTLPVFLKYSVFGHFSRKVMDIWYGRIFSVICLYVRYGTPIRHVFHIWHKQMS